MFYENNHEVVTSDVSEFCSVTCVAAVSDRVADLSQNSRGIVPKVPLNLFLVTSMYLVAFLPTLATLGESVADI